MRPVEKVKNPIGPNGEELSFSHYQDAKPYLLKNLGEYCSYCERRINASLAVEHIMPKSLYPLLSTSWDNFLLSCANCNSHKKATDINPKNVNDFVWPHIDNTFRALSYSCCGNIQANPESTDSCQQKAHDTINLFGLDKNPATNSKASDNRWIHRVEAWSIASESKSDLKANDTIQLRRQIVLTALAQGHFSIWMTVFQDDPDMLKRLIDAFPGTSAECFDPQNAYKPIKRSGGQC